MIKRYGIEYKPKIEKSNISKEELEATIKEHPDYTCKQLGELYGLSKDTIRKYIKEFGIEYEAHKRKPIISPEELRNYIQQNPKLSQRQVAEHFGASKETVRVLVIENDIEYNTCKPEVNITKEELENLIKENPHLTKKEISEHFGTSTATIYLLVKEHNIDYRTKTRGKGKPTILKEDLESFIKENPDSNIEQIAEHFRAYNSKITSLIREYNIDYQKKARRKTISKEDLEKFILENPDLNLTQIAEHFNKQETTIINLIKEYNIDYQRKFRGKSIPKEDLEVFIKENPTLNLLEIAEHFGVHKETISNLIKAYDINYEPKLKRGNYFIPYWY